MKKTLIAVAAAAALTTSAFADITFGAWLRTLPVFAASDGEDVKAGLTNSWGWGARVARLDINATAADGKAGMHMGVFNDSKSGLGPDDGYYMWVKPIDQVKLTVGQLDNNTGLRGDFCYGSWNWVRPNNWLYDGEGLTFSKVAQHGALFEVFPVDGLQVFAAVPLAAKSWGLSETAFKNVQAGMAYSIDGIGKLKAQYIGRYTEAKEATATEEAKDAVNNCTIEAAFDLTAVDNLYVTAGFAYYKEEKDIKAALGASYQINEALKVSADFELKKVDADDATHMAFGAGVDYNLENGVALNGDFRALMMDVDGVDPIYSFSVGAMKGISSNASIGVAFQGTTNGCGFLGDGDKNSNPNYFAPAEADSFCWAIPVCVQVWF